MHRVTAIGAGTYINTVTLSPLSGTTNLGSSTATVPGTVSSVVTPSLTKTVGSSTVAAGATTSFTIVIGNAGPSTLTTASIVDSMPANFAVSAVNATPAGGASVVSGLSGTSVSGSVTIPVNGTISVVVNVTAIGAGTYINTVTLSPLSGTTNLGSSTATVPGTVSSVVTPSLTKTVGSSTVAAGATTSFTIVIGNAGPSTLTTASIVDSMPANFAVSAVNATPAGGASVVSGLSGTSVSGSVTIPVNGTISVVVNVTAIGAGTYINTVTLSPLSGTTNLGSSTATVPGTVSSVVTPSLTKTVGSSTVAAGATTSFTIVIGNAGPSTLTTASIVDSMPANFAVSAVKRDPGGRSLGGHGLSGTSVSGSVTIPVNGTSRWW